MKKLLSSCIAATMLTATSAMAAGIIISPSGHEITSYYDFKQWGIYADDTRKSCLMSKTDPDGNVFQLGLASNNKFGYVGVFTKMDVGVTDGEGEISIEVNGNTYFGTGNGVTNLENGYVGGYVLSDNPDFDSDIMSSDTLTAFPNSGNTYIINLEGSRRALKTARKCNSVNGYSN